MLTIIEDDLTGDAVAQLLEKHLDFMRSQSPADSVHALDLEKLRSPEITFWTAWNEEQSLLGCVALSMIDETHGEIKSMHVTQLSRGKGLSKLLCQHVMDQARMRGLKRLSLETGSTEGFLPALALYKSMGFEPCSPFGSYEEDPFSRFMTILL